ncbi:hypothetical protein A2774_00590 [Candidatus Roizmanbacteria bacterium RIFCSPHIGHO2_01_FULL_39_12c]|uniref:PIN domain-containing protein n=1 Tax=Candidatus Roizmanbacteria bacterium RIFCSPHIGHO2_01_FULL_39_12c TaxID=1802031 RepID=A0A1F7GA10_9BACT|nr:MAG: hypothetical protein A2774_00590 [Candidatus Roizmanbacteria bacterium RIFCSPHIGHO2_01_FULL_39_12c]OGK47368.1 MAG: hypothetical protein A2963_04510 [Candidatus Roizmanbacteria bacterium RIFCSPLOWO2_01_FULL_40_13]
MLDSFLIKVLPLNLVEAIEFVKIKIDLEKKKVPLAHFDILIASSAIANNLTLVTRNLKHFQRIKGLKLYTQLS